MNESEDLAIPDPDIRICSDVDSFAWCSIGCLRQVGNSEGNRGLWQAGALQSAPRNMTRLPCLPGPKVSSTADLTVEMVNAVVTGLVELRGMGDPLECL